MAKYYLNGGDAYRLKLWVDRPAALLPFTSKSKTEEVLAAEA